MRIRRLKKARHRMQVFRGFLGFREPYQVLVDGTFCQQAVVNSAYVQQSIGFIFKGKVKFLTTPCVVKETEKLGPFMMGATILLKQCKIHMCEHRKESVPATECILSMLGKDNPCHYLVATQDKKFSAKLRRRPDVPVIYLHGKVAVVHRASEKTYETAMKRAEQSLLLNEHEKTTLEELNAFKQDPQPSTSKEVPETKKDKKGKRKQKDDVELGNLGLEKKGKKKLQENENLELEEETVKLSPKKKKKSKKKRSKDKSITEDLEEIIEKPSKKHKKLLAEDSAW